MGLAIVMAVTYFPSMTLTAFTAGGNNSAAAADENQPDLSGRGHMTFGLPGTGNG